MRNKKIRTALGICLLGMAAFGLAIYTQSRVRPRQEKNMDRQTMETKVTIDNFSFAPQDITVMPGTTVTWVNQDDVPHTVVSTDKKFKSKALDTDDKFSFTFKDPGTYEYYCSVHPKMTAKVTVK